MKPGQLNRRCTLQTKAVGVDSIGQPVDTWVDVASFWGWIKTTSGFEMVKADRTTETLKASIRARYLVAKVATAGMRVVSGGVTYNIEAMQPDEAGREYVDLVCEVIK